MIQRLIGGIVASVLGVSVGGCARDDVRAEQPRSGPGEAAPPTAAAPDAPAHPQPGAGGTMKIASRDTIAYTPQTVGIAADGARWVGYAPNELKVFAGDTEQAKVTASLTPPVGELRLSADGKTIYAAPVKVDLATGTISPDADTLASWFTAGAKETAAGTAYEAAVASWSPDGQHVAFALRSRRARNEPRGQGAAAGPQRRVLVLDAAGKLVADLVHPGLAVVRSIAVADDAVVASGGGVVASALPSAKLVELLPPDAGANVVGFAGAGRFVLATTNTETKIWATGSWAPVATIPVGGGWLAAHPSKAVVALAPAPPGLSPDVIELWAFDGEPRKLGTVDAAKASGFWLGADDTLYIKRAAQPGLELVRLALP